MSAPHRQWDPTGGAAGSLVCVWGSLVHGVGARPGPCAREALGPPTTSTSCRPRAEPCAQLCVRLGGLGQAVPAPGSSCCALHPLPGHPRPLHLGVHVGSPRLPRPHVFNPVDVGRAWCSVAGLWGAEGVLGARIRPVCSQELRGRTPGHGVTRGCRRAERSRGTRVGCAGTRVRCRVGRTGACSVAALCCHGHGSAQRPGTPGTLPGAAQGPPGC